jgi:hypothetical protein
MKLEHFAKEIVRRAWECGDVEACDILDLAESCGVTVKVPFDPAVHVGEGAEDCEPGDDWYVFAPELAEPATARLVEAANGVVQAPFWKDNYSDPEEKGLD